MKDHPLFFPATTILGVAAALNSFLHWTELFMRWALLAVSLALTLFQLWAVFQRGIKSRSRKARIPRRSQSSLPGLTLVCVPLLALCLSGCAITHVTVWDAGTGKRTGRIWASSLLDSKNAVSKVRVSTNSCSVGSVSQESQTTTNLTDLAAKVVSAAISAAK